MIESLWDFPDFGPAIQVKHLTLDADAIGDICDGLTADRIIIVCKETEVTVLDTVIRQLGLEGRLQALITFRDLENWYRTCLNKTHRKTLGASLLTDFIREFSNEFPSLDGLPDFLNERGYARLPLAGDWQIARE